MKRTRFLLLAICLVGLLGKSAQAAISQDARQVRIVAEKMCCKGCAQKVAGQLYAAPGVTDVDANLKSKTVVITVSKRKGATLGQLWQAVADGEGGPSKLTTADATYTFVKSEASSDNSSPPKGTAYVVIDNLHSQQSAKKIAAQLYAIRGVDKVSVDMKQETLIVKNKNGQEISPWALAAAVTGAQERPLTVIGARGRMAIEWSGTANTAQQSTHSASRGIQR